MNQSMKCTTLEVEIFPAETKDDTFLDDEITAVRAVDTNLENFENTIRTMPVQKLREQVSQLSRQVISLIAETPNGEPSTEWEMEKKQLLDLAIAKKQIAETYLYQAAEDI
jgi:hypothetical protein